MSRGHHACSGELRARSLRSAAGADISEVGVRLFEPVVTDEGLGLHFTYRYAPTVNKILQQEREALTHRAAFSETHNTEPLLPYC